MKLGSCCYFVTAQLRQVDVTSSYRASLEKEALKLLRACSLMHCICLIASGGLKSLSCCIDKCGLPFDVLLQHPFSAVHLQISCHPKKLVLFELLGVESKPDAWNQRVVAVVFKTSSFHLR